MIRSIRPLRQLKFLQSSQDVHERFRRVRALTEVDLHLKKSIVRSAETELGIP